jgi:hypothetical protein
MPTPTAAAKWPRSRSPKQGQRAAEDGDGLQMKVADARSVQFAGDILAFTRRPPLRYRAGPAWRHHSLPVPGSSGWGIVP